jgi:hypothetical protein
MAAPTLTPDEVLLRQQNRALQGLPSGLHDKDDAIGGPLAALEQGQYDFTSLSYPLDLGIDPGKKHYIIFYINVQNGSSYNDPSSTIAGQTSTAFQNLTGDASSIKQLSGLSDGINKLLKDNNIIGLGDQGISLLPQTSRSKQAIALYLPDTLTFTYQNSYDTPSLTDVLGKLGYVPLAAQALVNLTEGKEKRGGSVFSNKDVTTATKGAAAEFIGSLGGGGQATEVAEASIGLAVNPQVQVVYLAPDLRSFQFEFVFAPTSAQEATVVQNILKAFRFHAAPEIAPGSTGRYFIPPDLFDIEIHHDGAENTKLPKISTCVLTNIFIDYAAAGVWSAFNDGSSVMTRLNLQFTEIEIMTRGRIDSGY